MPGPDDPWPGCHGARLHPPDLAFGYGAARGVPLAEVILEHGPAGPPGDRLFWRLDGEVTLPTGTVTIDQSLTQRADGTMHLFGPGGTHLGIEPGTNRLVIEGGEDHIVKQVVVTIGLPLLLHAAGVLLLHAAAACRDGEAVLIGGPSGAGKSSLLVGLIDDGWQAISEDLCAVDLRGPRPMVWPGPPWVRRAGSGPAGASVRFETPDKTAWDLAPWQVDEPTPIRSVVALEPPGGHEVERRALSRPDALAALARAAFWIGAPDERAAAVFGPCVRLLGATSVVALRSPVDPDWVAPTRAALS